MKEIFHFGDLSIELILNVSYTRVLWEYEFNSCISG
jgi:hypothetical protein